MYQGDTRTRTIDIYVDEVLETSWTSSGTTADFESVGLGISGHTIELRGVLAESEWLSIAEVEILVDDGFAGGDDDDAVEVEAGTLASVTTSAVLYDARLSNSNGCDPEGCTAALTRDGDMSDGSRWSCAPSLGGSCSISYDLGAVRNLSQLRVALYKGDTRTRTMDVSIDGTLAITWTSSGTTSDFQSIDMSGYTGRSIEITGVLDDSEWISIIETEIMVLSGGVAPPLSPTPTTPAPVLAPVIDPTDSPVAPTPHQLVLSEEIRYEDTTVTITTTQFDSRLSDDGGCDPSGCTAALTRDGDLGEASRWSCALSLGGEDSTCTISYDIGTEYDIAFILLAMYKGDERQRTIEIYVDDVLVTTWTSSGTTNDFEVIALPPGTAGTMIDIKGVLDGSEWLSITETEIFVWPKDVVTTPPTPMATVSPAPVEPTPPPTVAPVGPLTPMGPIPLPTRAGPIEDLYFAKDGDLSTAWTCTGREAEPDGSTKCYILFDFVYYRNLKQVKIALSDGAERSVDMKISGRNSNTVAEEFVTSSGTTDGLETYEFDNKTNEITIAAVFSGPEQSFSISEVEFVEELAEDEARISSFEVPYNGDGGRNEVTTDGFEWTSDSDEAIDLTLSFVLAGYFTVTEMQLKFPVGDTYKFELWVYNEMDDTDEPYVIITNLESADAAGWQSFDLTSYADRHVTSIGVVMKGTGSGAPGFKLLDARILGIEIFNPTGIVYVGSTTTAYWSDFGRTNAYPAFVTTGTGDQTAINAAICAVKKASYDGQDCVGGDDTATGTVKLSLGPWYIDGNILMKSGVVLKGGYSYGDFPYITSIALEEGAAGNTDVDAIIVMDGISDAWVEDFYINGLYDPETRNDSPAVSGLGSTCISIVNSQNISIHEAWIQNCDGDAVVVRNSDVVNIDAGTYDREGKSVIIGDNRGTGLMVDSSDSVYVRRHFVLDNGVAGIHIMGSHNFTFQEASAYDDDGGQGGVGSYDSPQLIDVIIESSSLVQFRGGYFVSSNDPVISVSESTAVSFTDCHFNRVETGTCVIQTDDPSAVTVVSDEDELLLEDTCFVKV
ncbi:unnamed protein product [Scytosiphon promiscuus]